MFWYDALARRGTPIEPLKTVPHAEWRAAVAALEVPVEPGDPLEPLGRGHIRRTVVLRAATYLLAAALFLGIRALTSGS